MTKAWGSKESSRGKIVPRAKRARTTGSLANELELASIFIPRSNDLAEVLAIHKQLFKESMIGLDRSELSILGKWGGTEYFLVVSKIRDAGNYVFTEFAKESYLIGLDKETFIKRLTYYYDQLNYIHPFREGNGRTQRVFWSRVGCVDTILTGQAFWMGRMTKLLDLPPRIWIYLD